MRPYALRMQPYALIMHFLPASKKLGGSRAESTCKKPYALYAPLLGVGVFSAFFLLREVHTVHTAAYGSHRNQALALLPVGMRHFLPAKTESAYATAYAHPSASPAESEDFRFRGADACPGLEPEGFRRHRRNDHDL